ncbi:MAG: hypothetical protein Q9N34_07105 [Aquificota bacterium]|nr:hypothetical protein [Aquificota bacterium]
MLISLLLLFLSLVHGKLYILSTEENEASFSVKRLGKGFCFSGRHFYEDRGYDEILLGCRCNLGGGEAYTLGSYRDDYSYTLERYRDLCLAGITTFLRGRMDIAITLFGEGGVKELSAFGGDGDDMLWYMKKVREGYLLVGGVKEEDWDILVIKLGEELKPEWWRRFGTGAQEYAYGVVEKNGRYYVVGRSNYRGNWDGFILLLSEGGKLLESYLFGSGKKDYLRYVGMYRGKVLAVGRSLKPSETAIVMLYLPEEGRYFLYDSGEFDYGRVFEEREEGVLVMGIHYREGVSDGLLLFSEKISASERLTASAGREIESIRYLDGGLIAGYTYSFSLDNDVLVGRLPKLCPGFMRKLDFREVKAVLRRHPYPLEERDYTLRSLKLNISLREIYMKLYSPCQE